MLLESSASVPSGAGYTGMTSSLPGKDSAPASSLFSNREFPASGLCLETLGALPTQKFWFNNSGNSLAMGIFSSPRCILRLKSWRPHLVVATLFPACKSGLPEEKKGVRPTWRGPGRPHPLLGRCLPTFWRGLEQVPG